jgi:hypothetical protein
MTTMTLSPEQRRVLHRLAMADHGVLVQHLSTTDRAVARALVKAGHARGDRTRAGIRIVATDEGKDALER